MGSSIVHLRIVPGDPCPDDHRRLQRHRYQWAIGSQKVNKKNLASAAVASDGNALAALPVSTKVVNGMAFSPDGKWLALGAADKKIRIWEMH